MGEHVPNAKTSLKSDIDGRAATLAEKGQENGEVHNHASISRAEGTAGIDVPGHMMPVCFIPRRTARSDTCLDVEKEA